MEAEYLIYYKRISRDHLSKTCSIVIALPILDSSLKCVGTIQVFFPSLSISIHSWLVRMSIKSRFPIKRLTHSSRLQSYTQIWLMYTALWIEMSSIDIQQAKVCVYKYIQQLSESFISNPSILNQRTEWIHSVNLLWKETCISHWLS